MNYIFLSLQVILHCPLDFLPNFKIIPNIITLYHIRFKSVSVLKCAAPDWTVTGGTFDCAGQETNWNGVCNLNCDIDTGYTGDAQITCNDVDDDAETVDWDSEPTCTCKWTIVELYVDLSLFLCVSNDLN